MVITFSTRAGLSLSWKIVLEIRQILANLNCYIHRVNIIQEEYTDFCFAWQLCHRLTVGLISPGWNKPGNSIEQQQNIHNRLPNRIDGIESTRGASVWNMHCRVPVYSI